MGKGSGSCDGRPSVITNADLLTHTKQLKENLRQSCYQQLTNIPNFKHTGIKQLDQAWNPSSWRNTGGRRRGYRAVRYWGNVRIELGVDFDYTGDWTLQYDILYKNKLVTSVRDNYDPAMSAEDVAATLAEGYHDFQLALEDMRGNLSSHHRAHIDDMQASYNDAHHERAARQKQQRQQRKQDRLDAAAAVLTQQLANK